MKQLEIFRSVVVYGSITKASRRIGLSQPSISQQLAKFEETLETQLIVRNRTGLVELTQPGEFWFKTATSLTKQFETAIAEHKLRFREGNMAVRLGTTPTLRGRFAAAVARIALEEDSFARFEMQYSLNSHDVVQELQLHQINLAVVNSVAIEGDQASNSVTPIFTDSIAWVVPNYLSDDDIRRALKGESAILQKYPELLRYVKVGPTAPMQPASDSWYRNNLPASAPSFGTMTYVSAIELVAEGLCTTHCPLSLLPNVSAQQSRDLRWIIVDDLSRDIVLVIPKHLLSITAYARVHDKIRSFVTSEYHKEMHPPEVTSLSRLLNS